MLVKNTQLLIITLVLLFFALPLQAVNPSKGRYIARTMHLLETSTPTNRNVVKIAVYGQSISMQKWWKEVRDSLIKRYPYADIEMKNLSLGGFSTQKLWKTTEMDITTYYPDLVIFHCYGSHYDYEKIIRIIRERTIAEMLIQTDHYTRPDKWSDTVSYHILPAFCKKYGLELCDIRRPYIKYLEENRLKPADLLSDAVHLNDQGNRLFARITLDALVYNAKYANEASKSTRDYVPKKDFTVHNEEIKLSFTGNAVELHLNKQATADSLHFFIDEKKPSEYPDCYQITRPNNKPNVDWPWATGAVYGVTYKTPWLLEDWTLTFTRVDSSLNSKSGAMQIDYFEFDITGSKTGFDGHGNSNEKFVSKSERIVIDPENWWINESFQKKVPIKAGYTITFSIFPMFSDGGLVANQSTLLIARGLPNGKHTLRIEGVKNNQINKIRCFSPRAYPKK